MRRVDAVPANVTMTSANVTIMSVVFDPILYNLEYIVYDTHIWMTTEVPQQKQLPVSSQCMQRPAFLSCPSVPNSSAAF